MCGTGGGCAVYFLLFLFFITIIATNTECQGNREVSSLKIHPGLIVLVAVLDAPSLLLELFLSFSVAFTVAVDVSGAITVTITVSIAVTVAAALVSSTGPFS
jgi:hypothetical protein